MAYQLLFADDSATMHRVLQITFAKEDFQIIGVNSGQAALAKAKEVKPDVAVIDISMPGMDGYAVCHSLKSDPATAQIPVLLLAGSQEPFDESRAQASGANSHVVKPFETQVLIDRVKTLVGAPITSATATAARPAAAQPAPVPAAAPPPTSPPVAPRPASAPVMGAAATGAPAPPPTNRPVAFGAGATAPAATTGFTPTVPAGGPTPGWAAAANAPAPRPSGAPAVPPSTPAPFGGIQPGMGAPRPPAAPPAVPKPAPAPAAVATPPARPVAPVAQPPVTPAVARAPLPTAESPAIARAVSEAANTMSAAGLPVDQAQILAMARDIVERVVWEVVPELANAMIQERLDQLVKERA